MRTFRLSLTTSVLLALVVGLSGVVGAQFGAETKTEPEAAWATMRHGVFADRAEWEARFDELDPGDEEQVRQLRRLVRDQVKLLEGLDLGDSWNSRFACLGEAHMAVDWAAADLDQGLTSFVLGRPNAKRVLREGRVKLREYWELRDDVDCSTAGEVAAFLRNLEYETGLPFRPVTGRRVEYDYVASEDEPRYEGNAMRVDGDTTYERWEWSDPLLPPDLTNRMNMASFGLGWEGMVIVASLLFEGSEGSWTGTGQGRTWVLTGHGVYEGLSAILTTTADTDADTLTVEGTIYAGPLPAIPEPLAPVHEPMPDTAEPTPRPTLEATPEPTPGHTEEPAVPPATEDPALPTENPAFNE